MKSVVEEREVVRICLAHERGRVDELDPSYVGDADLWQSHDLVAGAGSYAKDPGVVAEEAKQLEGAEEAGVGRDWDWKMRVDQSRRFFFSRGR